MSKAKATVLLAKGLDENNNIIEVRATPYFQSGNSGVADSRSIAQRSGLLVPSYCIAEGRIAAARDAEARGNINLALEESVWTDWHDAFAETNTFKLTKSYKDFEQGRYVADIVNGAVFSHNHERIINAVLKRELQRGAIRLTEQDKNLLFGEGMVYAWKDGELKAVKPDYVFKSGAEFLEASADPDFLKNMPVYVVIRTADEADKEPSGYRAIDSQRDNIGLAIRFGGQRNLDGVLDATEKLSWSEFGSYHDGYNNEDGGRVVVVYGRYGGVRSGSDLLSSDGRSLAVAPEALESRAKIVKPLEIVVQDAKMVPEDHVRRLLAEEIGLNTERTEQYLKVLAQYTKDQ